MINLTTIEDIHRILGITLNPLRNKFKKNTYTHLYNLIIATAKKLVCRKKFKTLVFRKTKQNLV